MPPLSVGTTFAYIFLEDIREVRPRLASDKTLYATKCQISLWWLAHCIAFLSTVDAAYSVETCTGEYRFQADSRTLKCLWLCASWKSPKEGRKTQKCLGIQALLMVEQ
jgi:hypothetical protein